MTKIVNTLREMDKHVQDIQSNVSDILDIAQLPGVISEVSDLLNQEGQMITIKISQFKNDYTILNRLLNKIEFEKIDDDEGTSSSMDTDSKATEKPLSPMEISLKPQTSKLMTFRSPMIERKPFVKNLHPAAEVQEQIMKELYSLTSSDYRVLDFTGVFCDGPT